MSVSGGDVGDVGGWGRGSWAREARPYGVSHGVMGVSHGGGMG